MKYWSVFLTNGDIEPIGAKSYTITDGVVTFWERSFEVMGFQSVTGKVASFTIPNVVKIVGVK